MPLQATSGAASYDAFGGGVPVTPVYIEDVMSVWLYTGNGTTQTINNGIDLAGKGGMVWIKQRSGTANHALTDTARGTDFQLASNSDAAQSNVATRVTAFNADGFNLGASSAVNGSGSTYVGWTFREQPKFFDVVTYTGNGVAGSRTLNHNLGAVPGCIIVKRTDAAGYWAFSHTATPSLLYALNSTAAGTGFADTAGISANGYSFLPDATATTFKVSPGQTDASAVNASGGTYVAYLFAHNAGGFGLSGTDNVISCGSFTSSSIGLATVDLEYEPQWILYKGSNGVTNWQLVDNMRGFVVGAANSGTSFLNANTSAAEGTNPPVGITNTGFNFDGAANITYIYIAIRRGPMRTPTTGTSVFAPVVATSGTATTNFPVDMQILSDKGSANAILNQQFVDRLRGVSSTTTQQGVYLLSSSTAAESSAFAFSSKQWSNTGFGIPQNYEGNSSLYLSFRRAPGFFDEVCYTGNGSTQTITHNLTVVPELIIAKNRGQAGNNWPVLFNFASTTMNYGFLNLTNSCPNDTYANVGVFSAAPTSTSMFLTNSSSMNASGFGIVAYLFASCPGVSKVGSYTGNGTSQTINCGFTSGARFVMVKRTDSTGNWMVVDTARGLVSAGDPTLYLNSTAAEVTGVDWLDPDSSGFIVNQEGTMNANVNAATYIFLSIA